MAETLIGTPHMDLERAYVNVRRQTESLCAPLTPEDMMVQSCADASPAKWHLAHTTWFFETFLLSEFLPGYRPFHPDFHWLFNSYYNAVSSQPVKSLRGSFSRPSLDQVLAYRLFVDNAMSRLMQRDLPPEAARRITLGLNHEQQHQELLLYDIKHAFWTNPLHPAYLDEPPAKAPDAPSAWIPHSGGLAEIGSSGGGFCFDNEQPRHKAYVEPFELASRLVTCAEYLNFISDGGYDRPELWLSDGWDIAKAQQWRSPLYWFASDGQWFIFTLRGPVDLITLMATPVCHVSYYEADAFARWAGKRLPAEVEWEVAAAPLPVRGNLLESFELHPTAPPAAPGIQQIFGDVWEWTSSAYLGYPGYKALPGALGEYNGKFMSNKMVLRGGSAVTPASHIRSTYRNFFPPVSRWQFCGVRLANRQE